MKKRRETATAGVAGAAAAAASAAAAAAAAVAASGGSTTATDAAAAVVGVGGRQAEAGSGLEQLPEMVRGVMGANGAEQTQCTLDFRKLLSMGMLWWWVAGKGQWGRVGAGASERESERGGLCNGTGYEVALVVLVDWHWRLLPLVLFFFCARLQLVPAGCRVSGLARS